MTKGSLLKKVTSEYIEKIKKDMEKGNPIPPPPDIQNELLELTNKAIDVENACKPRNERWRKLSDLHIMQISDLMLALYHIVCVKCAGKHSDSDYDLLAVYIQKEGAPNEGTYDTNETTLHRIAKYYKRSLSKAECREILADLRDNAPHRKRCQDPDLIAVNNGIFNYKTKRLMPFSPDYVFLSKSHVNYNPDARNITIHNDMDGTDWDVESWMKELSDDPEIVNLLWEILGAIIRPNVRWGKSAWFYSETGNNGKGTLCSLMRSLCGDGTHTSISLSEFGKDFMLEPLIHASAIIVDENDVGCYIDRAANLKAIITNDVIQINRKHKTPVAYQFFGFMVQCLNELPKIRDRSDSFYRRQLFVPFTKCFTGQERKYIKADYLKRPEVLEYVLARVLRMDYYELSEPQACKKAVLEYKGYNDPIRQFMAEMNSLFAWDLLPFNFLYDLYKSWHKKSFPSSTPDGRNIFIQKLVDMLDDFPDWTCENRSKTIRPTWRMSVPEPLIMQYGLTRWMNPAYHGNDPDQKCHPVLSVHYNGLLRKVPKLLAGEPK